MFERIVRKEICTVMPFIFYTSLDHLFGVIPSPEVFPKGSKRLLKSIFVVGVTEYPDIFPSDPAIFIRMGNVGSRIRI